MFDLIIIGGGPAGTAAGVYAARKQLKTLLVTESFGGQSVVSPDIQNWIGTISISGDELAKSFKEHVEAYAGDTLTLKEGSRVENINKAGDGFEVTTNDEKVYQSTTVLIATGSDRRRLTIPGADTFEHKGVTYCASCDGPLFGGQDLVVIGGGNAGFETAAQLLAYAKSVTLIHRNDEYKADAVTVEKVLANPKMRGITNATPTEIVGENFVTGIKYKDLETGEVHDLPAGGVFVEIGAVPQTAFVHELVDIDEYKRIIVDPKTQRSSVEGVWAAGDCTDGLYHQNNIAAGDAVKALEDVYLALNAK